MSLEFACERCGHPFHVEERFAGKKGRCKHCGHIMPIPTESSGEMAVGAVVAADPPSTGGFKLRPVAGVDVPDERAAHHRTAPTLQVRPLATADIPHRSAEQVEADRPRDRRPIEVLDPYGFAKKQARRPFINPHYETRIARYVAQKLRITRDRLYLLSLALLVLGLIGFLFKFKAILHLATVGVVLTNILMLIDGVAYLLVVPFRQSLARGLAMLLIPPYAVYYWVRHWDKMKKPVLNTAGAFLPIVLVGLGYVLWQEAPVIMEEVEAVDRKIEKAIGIEPGPSNPAPEPRQPTVTDAAKQVLGGEANIIENLAQPQ